MPRYEYRCEANGRTIEVEHRMSDEVATWGELCKHADIDAGDTPADAPVEKLISLSTVGKREQGWTPPQGPCGQGCGCHPN